MIMLGASQAGQDLAAAKHSVNFRLASTHAAQRHTLWALFILMSAWYGCTSSRARWV